MYKCIFNVLQDKMMKSKIKEIVRKLKICKSYFWEAWPFLMALKDLQNSSKFFIFLLSINSKMSFPTIIFPLLKMINCFFQNKCAIFYAWPLKRFSIVFFSSRMSVFYNPYFRLEKLFGCVLENHFRLKHFSELKHSLSAQKAKFADVINWIPSFFHVNRVFTESNTDAPLNIS